VAYERVKPNLREICNREKKSVVVMVIEGSEGNGAGVCESCGEECVRMCRSQEE
jgi:hypothetical protein